MPTTQDIVQKLWNLCHVLRDDGITYHQYVTELTYLLFLKMADERTKPPWLHARRMPPGAATKRTSASPPVPILTGRAKREAERVVRGLRGRRHGAASDQDGGDHRESRGAGGH